jgi:hypothetical protein
MNMVEKRGVLLAFNKENLIKCMHTIISTTSLLVSNKATQQKIKGASQNKVFGYHILLNWGREDKC